MSKPDKQAIKKRWWNLTDWGFSIHERRAIWFLIALLLIGSSIRIHRHVSLSRNLDLKIEKTDTLISVTDNNNLNDGSFHKRIININSATVFELESLPGIGPAIAERIINYREAHGKFSDINELQNVKGIGLQKISQLQGEISVEDSPTTMILRK